MDKATAKAIKRLGNRWPFMRRKGAESLFGTEETQAVSPLVILTRDRNAKVRSAACSTLGSLQGKAADRFCEIWVKERDRQLEKILLENRYIAEAPLEVRYLTALKQDRREVIENAGRNGVDVLLDLFKDKDPVIANGSFQAICHLKNAEGINHLCALWYKQRKSGLDQFIRKAGYVALEPERLRALTTFLQDKRPNWTLSDQALAECLADSEEEFVAKTISHVLETEGIGRLWAFVLQQPRSHVSKLMHKKNFYPEDPADRALFYFLAGDLAKYHNIDFEHSHLRYWYETGSKAIKDAIAAGIRESGDVGLLAVFRTARGGRKDTLSEREAALQARILMKNGEYARLFDLLPFCGYRSGGRIVQALSKVGWKNPDPHGRALQERLEAIVPGNPETQGPSSFADAIFRDFRPMFFLNELSPPSDTTGLLAWVSDEENFRRRSAGLITLAERGAAELSDAANRACGDAYWQVRMAAAAADVLHPGTLSPANRALLAKDHVYWVQILLNQPFSGSLSDLGPEGIEALRVQMPKNVSEKKPEGPDNFIDRVKGFVSTPERDYLLTLAEFLGTDIEVSEEAGYAPGETDIDIEIEE